MEIPIAVGIVFVILKVFGVIDWHWLVVTAPIWGTVIFIGVSYWLNYVAERW